MSDPPGGGHVEVEIAHEALLQRWPRLRNWLAPKDESPRYGALLKQFRRDPARSNDRLLTRRIRRLVAAPAPLSAVDGVGHPPLHQGQVQVEVAHEALIRHWPTLRAWLDEDRTDLLLRESVREAAQEWEVHGRDESYLAHRGRRLDQAEELRQHPRLTLNPLEDAYLQASLASREREEQEREAQRQHELAAERERAELAEAARREAEQRVTEQKHATRRLRLVAALVGIAAIAAVFFALRAIQQEVTANRQATIARAQALAADAPRQHESGEDERGALLARQAFLFNQEVDGPIGASAGAALRAALGVPYYSVKLPDQGREAAFVDFGTEPHTLVTGSQGGTIYLWDLRDPAAIPYTLRMSTFPRTSIAFSPDGQMVATGMADASVQIWHLDKPEAEPIVLSADDDTVSAVYSIAFSTDGQSLATGSEDGTIRLWSIPDTQAEPTVVSKIGNAVDSVAFSADGNTLAGSTDDGTIRLWSVDDLSAAPEELVGQVGAANSFAFSPVANTLASGGADGTVRIWDLTSPTPTAIVLPEPAETVMQSIFVVSQLEVTSIAFAPDGLTLAAGFNDATIRLWDLESPSAEPIVLREPEERTVVNSLGGDPSVAFSSDGQILAAGGYGTTRLWYIQHPVSPRFLTGLEQSVYGVAFSPDGRTLASASIGFVGTMADGMAGDGKVRLWHPFDGSAADAPLVLPGQGGGAFAVAFSPDGQTLASGNSDGVIWLWDLREPSQMPRTLEWTEGVRAITFSPDGETLATGGYRGAIALWSLSDPNPRATVVLGPSGFEAKISSLGFSPDGRKLASGAWDGTVRLWHITTSPVASTMLLEQPGLYVSAVAISPDGATLAASGWDGLVRLWDLTQSPASQKVWRGEDGPTLSVAFSPDGKTLAYGSDGGTVRLRDVRNPVAAQIVLPPGGGPVRSLAFSPDGQTLAVGSEDAVVRLWIAGTESLYEIVCQLVWRNLTTEEWQQFVGVDVPYERTCPDLPAGEGAESAETLGIVAMDSRQ